MNIYKVAPDGSFKAMETGRMRGIISLAGVESEELRWRFEFTQEFSIDPDTGNLIVDVVVPAGSHPDWDNGALVRRMMALAMHNVGRSFSSLAGKKTNFDLSKTKVRVHNEGGGTNVSKTDLMEFFRMVSGVSDEDLASTLKGEDDSIELEDYVPRGGGGYFGNKGPQNAPEIGERIPSGEPSGAGGGSPKPGPKTETDNRTRTST
jgi:hypothetical protein